MTSFTSDEKIPPTAATKYRSWGGELFNPKHESPQHQLTDIIPVVVHVTAPAPSESISQDNEGHGLAAKLFKSKQTKSAGAKTTTKIVFLPRSEYLKWFATDENGVYMGTESKKEWTEKELDESFGSFRPAKSEKSNAGLIDRFFTAKARGL